MVTTRAPRFPGTIVFLGQEKPYACAPLSYATTFDENPRDQHARAG